MTLAHQGPLAYVTSIGQLKLQLFVHWWEAFTRPILLPSNTEPNDGILVALVVLTRQKLHVSFIALEIPVLEHKL